MDDGDDHPVKANNVARLFLEFTLATNTLDDPAPFCWPEFQSTVTSEAPPWSPRATPEETGLSSEEITSVKDFASAYWAPVAVGPRISIWHGASKNSKMGGGRAALEKWIRTKRTSWSLNTKFDAAMEAGGVTVSTMAADGLTRVRSSDCCGDSNG